MTGIKKINFIEARFDEESGMSIAKVECGNEVFINFARFNPEDAEKGIRPSKMKGCYIAEMRATKEALKWQLKEVQRDYSVVNEVINACKQNKDFDPSAPVMHTLFAQAKNLKRKIIFLKTGMYDIDCALDKMIK